MNKKSIFNTIGNVIEVANNTQDDSLVVLYDLGFGSGKLSHIKTASAMVDVTTLTTAINEDSGYQRELIQDRVNKDAEKFNIVKFDPITISIRNNKRYVIDGQKRTVMALVAYKKGIYPTPMIPCKIIRNASVEDEAHIFATQKDGETPLTPKNITKAELVEKNQKVITINNILNNCSMNLLGTSRSTVKAHKTMLNLFDLVSENNFKRIFNVISKAWEHGEVKNSTCSDIIKGLGVFYKFYSEEIDDTYFISKLSRTTPDVIRDDFKNWDTKLDPNRKYIKTFATIYSKNKKTNRIDV